VAVRPLGIGATFPNCRLFSSLGWLPMGGRMRPPYTVIAYATLVATILVVSLVREGAHQGLVFAGSVWGLATLGLWRSSWGAWLFLVTVVSASSVVFMLIRWPSSLYVASAVILHGTLLALLLSRPTRRYTRPGRPRFLPG
jgi:hypothetical protein